MKIPRMFCIYSSAPLSSTNFRFYVVYSVPDIHIGSGDNTPGSFKEKYSKKYHYKCHLVH
jgi:hypothetical protein